MNKKVFISGVITGIISSVVAVAGVNFTAQADAIRDSRFSIEDKIDYITSIMYENYVDELDPKALEDGVYRGLVEGLGDPYSVYYSAEELQTVMENTSGTFYGVGITVQLKQDTGKMFIVSVIEGSPAEKAGLMEGDYIVKVNGQDIVGMDLDSAVSLIKGEKGTEVNLTVERDGKEIELISKRDEINVDSVAGEVIEGNIGYIYISGFKGNTYDQFMKVYNNLRAQKISGLIIDVRDNPGGVLPVVEKLTDELIPEGTLVYTIDRDGKREDYMSDAKCIDIPLVVVVNENSASASEILAGAVQDTGTGVLVGTQTYGKGSVQNLYRIPDGSGVKVTTHKYYTPKGVCIHGTGITPDYVVEEDIELLINEGVDLQLNKAVEIIKEKLK